MKYFELQTISNFSFLKGASHPAELILTAKKLGLSGLGLADENSMAGVVRAHQAAKELNFRFIPGAKLKVFYDLKKAYKLTVLAYPLSLSGYENLTTLLTLGKRRSSEHGCILYLEDLLSKANELVFILLPPLEALIKAYDTKAKEELELFKVGAKLLSNFKLFCAITKSFNHQAHISFKETVNLAAELKLSLVATNNVQYHTAKRKILHDVLCCIRNKTTISSAGYTLGQNGERHLKDAKEMQRLFRELPEALENTELIAKLTEGFSLEQLKYEYPKEIYPDNQNPLEYLTKLSWQGAKERYPAGIPAKVTRTIQEELRLIHELKYEKYFLTCYDIVSFARKRGILCQGRGAAANSAVCFCLGLTAVDPDKIDLLFARFVSKARSEPPDIDLDFEHERREEVIQYIYQKYGRERAALVCEVVSYRHRSALRDVAKVMGLPLATINILVKNSHRWRGHKLDKDELSELGINPHDPVINAVIVLSKELQSFPRHLSQHVGGFVITEKPLSHIVPIANATMEARTIIEWDKNDIEALGMLKIDILALGMLSCIRKALIMINREEGRKKGECLALYSIPADDRSVYNMICASDTIGVFQIESRAQMSMLPRLKPRCFYDLVIEVAIVRPGPIQGQMVHPFLRRRNGQEKPYYPDARAKDVLGKTLGVPIFQEQAMRLAIVLADFKADEAERLRRAMAAWKTNNSKIQYFQKRIMKGMLKNGYTRDFAINCVNQLKGFSEYGFPESHAASFAHIVYASAWIKHHHPAIFAAALINSQPMCFYAPAQIIDDAKRHGVTVLPIDLNYSNWNCCTINKSGKLYLRLGFRLIRGMSYKQAQLIEKQRRANGLFNSIADLWQRGRLCSWQEGVKLRKQTLYLLAKADAYQSLKLARRAALWTIRALPNEALPLEQAINDSSTNFIREAPKQEQIFNDYESSGLSLKGHPLAALRGRLSKLGLSTAAFLRAIKNPSKQHQAGIAGMVLFKQRPPTAKGVVFITLEDETGIANLILNPKVFEKSYRTILNSDFITAYGKLEKVGTVVYIVADRVEELTI